MGSVILDGQEIKLRSDLAEVDARRVNAASDAVAAAIPDKYDRFMHPD